MQLVLLPARALKVEPTFASRAWAVSDWCSLWAQCVLSQEVLTPLCSRHSHNMGGGIAVRENAGSEAQPWLLAVEPFYEGRALTALLVQASPAQIGFPRNLAALFNTTRR